MRLLIQSLLFLLISHTASAEYRVFSLVITNSQTKNIKQIETTLDPDQYRSIYLLGQNESITYVETWKCLGRTNFFKNHCAQSEKSNKTD